MAFPSYRSKADYTCYDRWINLMKNNTVHIRISIKYLHEKMVVQLIEGLLVYLVFLYYIILLYSSPEVI